LEQLLAAKLTSQGWLHAYGWPTGAAVQSGESFRKKVLKINAFLTLLTIEKNQCVSFDEAKPDGIYSQVWE
jgi:hypothetical protein